MDLFADADLPHEISPVCHNSGKSIKLIRPDYKVNKTGVLINTFGCSEDASQSFSARILYDHYSVIDSISVENASVSFAFLEADIVAIPRIFR